MEGEAPSIDEVRLQLHRILVSAEFHSSEDARELLRFCVEKSLCGEYDVLRETQAVFSSQAEALRAKLGRYYAGEGRNEPIRIDVPAGTIVPQFSHHVIAAEAAGERPGAAAYRNGALALLIVIAAGIWWRSQASIKPKVEPELRRLTSDLGLSTYPALSADGKWLAYASSRSGEGNLDLYLLRISGGDAVRLTQDPADEKEPSFSPDGKTIAYRSERNSGGVYTIGTDGSGEKLVAPLGRNPRYSPDGKWILYWVQGEDFRPGSMWVAPSGGGAPRRFHADFQDGHTPIWSPDGSHILFCGTKDADRPVETDGHDWWVAKFPEGPVYKTGASGTISTRDNFSKVSAALDSSQWVKNSIIYTARSGDTTNIWRVRISAGHFRIEGKPERLNNSSSMELHPAAAGNLLVFTSGSVRTSVWGAALDTENGKVTGPVRRFTQHASAWDQYSSVSLDGRKLSFLSDRSGSGQVWIRELPSGREFQLTSGGEPKSRPRISPDGSMVAYRVMEQKLQAIYVSPTDGPGAQERRICADCGMPLGWTWDGQQVLFETGKTKATVAVVDAASKPSYRYQDRPESEILMNPAWGVHAGRVSPNRQSIAFHADSSPGHKQLFLAPYSAGRVIRVSDWIALTDGTHVDQYPVWSPGGKMLYFLSERDGSRCIWGLKMDPATNRQMGEPFPLLHFHSAAQSLFTTIGDRPDAVGLWAGRNLMVFSLDEVASNIWSMPLPQ